MMTNRGVGAGWLGWTFAHTLFGKSNTKLLSFLTHKPRVLLYCFTLCSSTFHVLPTPLIYIANQIHTVIIRNVGAPIDQLPPKPGCNKDFLQKGSKLCIKIWGVIWGLIPKSILPILVYILQYELWLCGKRYGYDRVICILGLITVNQTS